jgi:hypothetical protein
MVFTSVFTKSARFLSSVYYRYEWSESVYSDKNLMKFIVFTVKIGVYGDKINKIMEMYNEDKNTMMNQDLEYELHVCVHNIQYYRWQLYHLYTT